MITFIVLAAALEITAPSAVRVTIATYPEAPIIGEIPRVDILIENTSSDEVRLSTFSVTSTYCGRDREVEFDCDSIENCSAGFRRPLRMTLGAGAAALLPVLISPPSFSCGAVSDLVGKISMSVDSGAQPVGELSISVRFFPRSPSKERDVAFLEQLLSRQETCDQSLVPLPLLGVESVLEEFVMGAESAVSRHLSNRNFDNSVDYLRARDEEVLSRISDSDYALRHRAREACLADSTELQNLLQPTADFVTRLRREDFVDSAAIAAAVTARYTGMGYSCCAKRVARTARNAEDVRRVVLAEADCGDPLCERLLARFEGALATAMASVPVPGETE